MTERKATTTGKAAVAAAAKRKAMAKRKASEPVEPRQPFRITNRWLAFGALVLVCATAQNVADANVKVASATRVVEARPTVVTVPVYLPAPTTTTTTAPTTTTTAPPVPPTMPVEVPAPVPPTTTTTAPATLSAANDACLRTTFTDGSFVNLRKTSDRGYERC